MTAPTTPSVIHNLFMTTPSQDKYGPLGRQKSLHLSLHAAAGVSGDEPLNVRYRHLVEISRNGLLQRAGGHGEFQRGFQIASAHEPVDQPCGEAVAAANPVNHAHGVALALKEGRCRGVIEHG